MPEYRGNPSRSAAFTIFSVLFAVTLAGCASTQEPPAPATTPVVRPSAPSGTSPDLAGQEVPDVLNALSVTRNGAAERRYGLTSGTKPPQTHLVRLIAGAAGAERWSLLTATCEAGATIGRESVEQLEFELNAAGDVALRSTTDVTEKVLTEFQPALRVLPAKLAAGETVSQAVTMIVRPLGKPGTIQNQGPATQVVTHLGLERITVGAGGFDAHHIRTVLKGSLGGAEVTITTETWYAPGVGIVAETNSQRVTLLGIAVRSSATKLELVQAGQGTAPIPGLAPAAISGASSAPNIAPGAAPKAKPGG